MGTGVDVVMEACFVQRGLCAVDRSEVRVAEVN